VNVLSQECDDELAEVGTAVDAALEELNNIQQQDYAALRAVRQPTPSIKLIMEAMCLLKGLKPDKIPDGGGGGKMVDDYWGPAKRILGEQKFLASMVSFEKDEINPKTMKLIRDKYLNNTEIDPEVTKQSIGAGDNIVAALYKWLLAIDNYDKAAKIVAPKREAIAKTTGELEEANKSLREKQAVFDEANDKLKIIQAELATKKSKKAELENEVETCSRKLERAEQLIGGLGGERDKWAEIVGNLGNKYVKLTGDILLSSALVVYLGSEMQEDRQIILQKWMEKCEENQVPFSDNYTLFNVLGDEITRQAWQLNGLPSDDFSTDNGIITFTSKRWILMLDPQEIGKKWIQSVEKKNNLQVLRQSDTEFLRNLESSIQFGQPALLENVGDSLDPILEPLLTKQTFKQGGSVCLKLGDSTLEYHKDFKLYITTKLSKPKFVRDTVSKIALVNFSITRLGLDEQLLTITVTRERPELEEERAQLIVQANDNRKQLRDIENKILEVLYTSKGNILEDENAIKVLSSSKVLANEITEKQNSALESEKKIDESRQPYLHVAAYVGVLFFAISELSHVNHMYQYSLSWFINLFCNSIDLADKSEELDERLESIKDYMTQALYQSVARGISNADRALFSFLLSANIAKHKGKISEQDWKDFISVISLTNLINTEDEDKVDFEASGKDNLAKLVEIRPKLQAVLDSFTNNLETWKGMATDGNFTCLSFEVPDSIELAEFEKLMVISAIDTKNLVPLTFNYTKVNLGDKYIKAPLPDIHKAFVDSSCTTPIVIILGETADPCLDIYSLGEKLNIVGKRLQFICLGEGKEKKAEDLLREGVQAGNWVILQNCHMVPHWLPKLEYICETLDEDVASPDFRIWITTKPRKSFPIPILQNCIKVTQEEPDQVKNSLTQAFPPTPIIKKSYETMTDEIKRMALSMAFFHSLINERTGFGSVGWNEEYVFPSKDRALSLEYLKKYIGSDSISSLKSIADFICNSIVGSGIEDITDSMTLRAILDRFCTENIIRNDQVMLDKSDIYQISKYDDLESLNAYINNLPISATPDMLNINIPMHLHQASQESRSFMRKLVLTQNMKTARTEQLTFQQIKDKVDAVLEKMPEQIKVDEENDEAFDIVLLHEVKNWNNLMEMTKDLFKNCRQAILGDHVVTEEVEMLMKSICDNVVPKQFQVRYNQFIVFL
jgi:dynein heavy chain